MSKETTPQDHTPPAPSRAPVSALDRPCIIVDYEKYAHFLEDADLTDEEKQAFIHAIWSIITDFVSLGFGVHPLQQAGYEKGNDRNTLSNNLSDVITWKNPTHTNTREKSPKSTVRRGSEKRGHDV